MENDGKVGDSFTTIIDTAYGLKEQRDYGELFTIREFIENCDSSSFIDYDGFGHLATADKESTVDVIPSEVRKTISLNPWATHVLWFNR